MAIDKREIPGVVYQVVLGTALAARLICSTDLPSLSSFWANIETGTNPPVSMSAKQTPDPMLEALKGYNEPVRQTPVAHGPDTAGLNFF